MGANLTRHFLMRSKIKVRVIYFSVIEQVEPQSHAGEKAAYDSLGDHINIIHSACPEKKTCNALVNGFILFSVKSSTH